MDNNPVRNVSLAVALAIYLLMLPFDGLFRVVALKSNIFLLNGWKDLFLICLVYFGIVSSLASAINNRQRIQVAEPLLTAFVFLIGIFGIATGCALESITLMQGLWAFKVLYLPLLLFVAVQCYPSYIDNEFLTSIIKKLFAISVPIVLFGIIQFFMGWKKVSLMLLDDEVLGGGPVSVITIGGFLRAFSTLRDPFTFGDYCSMLLIFVTAFLMFSRLRPLRYHFVFLTLLAGIIVSTSRVSFMTAIIGIALLIFFRLSGNQASKNRSLLFSMSALLGALFIIAYYVAFHSHGVQQNTKGDFGASIAGTGSVFQRFLQWKSAFQRYPFDDIFKFFMGWGTGVVGVAEKKFTSSYHFIDNFYLLVLIMHGVVGLLVWMLYIIRNVCIVIRHVTDDANKSSSHFWILAGTAAYVLSQFVEFVFRTTLEGFPAQIYFWTFLALAIRIVRARSS